METKTKTVIARWVLAIVWCAVVGVAIAIVCAPAASDTPARTIPAPAALEPKAPTMTVIDNTQGAWGGLVVRAAEAWDRSPLVNINHSPVPVPGTYNVYVSSYAYGETGWLGIATPLDVATMHIQINTWDGYEQWLDRKNLSSTIAHELGHALGIPHPDEDADPGVSGVIMDTEGGERTALPTGADYAALKRSAASGEGGVFQYARMGD